MICGMRRAHCRTKNEAKLRQFVGLLIYSSMFSTTKGSKPSQVYKFSKFLTILDIEIEVYG